MFKELLLSSRDVVLTLGIVMSAGLTAASERVLLDIGENTV